MRWTAAANRGDRVLATGVMVAVVVAACGGGTPNENAPTTSSTSTTAPVVTTTTTIGEATADDDVPTATELCDRAIAEPAPAEVAADELTEISGIAASRRHDGQLWVHNDSGAAAQLHLVAADGQDLGTWPFPGTLALDWEDMDIGPGPDGTDHLYVGDIGDNLTFRSTIRVHRLPEPSDVSTPTPLDIDTLTLSYPDGAHDAESLLVDPIGGQIHIVTKFADGSTPSLYRAPAGSGPGDTIELELVAAIDLDDIVSRSERALGDPAGTRIPTAAAISPSGTVIAMRTYNDVLLWDRDPSESVAEAMTRAPCVALSVDEKQGETVTFLPDGSGYVTISEGKHPSINRFVIPEVPIAEGSVTG